MRYQDRAPEEGASGDKDVGYEADDEMEEEQEEEGYVSPRQQRRKKRIMRPSWHRSMRFDCTTVHDPGTDSSTAPFSDLSDD